MRQITYYPGGYVAAAPHQNIAQQFDDVAQTVTSWDAAGIQTGIRAYTAAEIAAVQASAAQATASTNAATLQQRATNALTANTAFLALVAPTNVQVVAQVQLLTKECSALIRLLLGQLDSTS